MNKHGAVAFKFVIALFATVVAYFCATHAHACPGVLPGQHGFTSVEFFWVVMMLAWMAAAIASLVWGASGLMDNYP